MAAFFRPWDSENVEIEEEEVQQADTVQEVNVQEVNVQHVNVQHVNVQNVVPVRAHVPEIGGLSPTLSLYSDSRSSSAHSESQPGTSTMSLSPYYCGPAAAPEWGNISAMYAASHQRPMYGWLPTGMQEAVNRLSREDEVAKQRKKLRPKKYICGRCNQAFSNNGQLKGHARIHTGERPFRCDYEGCRKAFTRNEELTRHKRIHTGQKPFGCPICNKNFGRKDHLKKHTKTHENRTAYQMAAAAASMPFAGYAFPYQLPTASLPYVYQL